MASTLTFDWLNKKDFILDFEEIPNRSVVVKNVRLADFVASKSEDGNGVRLQTAEGNYIILKNAPKDVNISISFKDGKKTYTYLSNLAEGFIVGTEKSNTIVTTQDGLKVNAGAGSDKITVNGTGNKIFAEAGADTITVNGVNNDIQTNDGKDTVLLKLDADNNTVDTGADNDKITIKSTGNTIYAGDGNDTIIVSASGNTINGGAGDDKITIDWNLAKNITLNEHDPAEDVGNDYIILKNIAFHDFTSILFSDADHNELKLTDANGDTLTIKNWQSQNVGKIKFKDCTKTWEYLDKYAQGTIIGGEGTDKITVVESKYAVETYNGSDKITINGNENEVYSGLGNDSITVKGTGNFIYGEDGKDTVTVYGVGNDVQTASGIDTVVLKMGANNTKVDTGADNDKITVYSDNNTINANDGDDNIVVNGNANTIQTGAGNDKLTIDWRKAKDTTIVLSDDGLNTLIFNYVKLSDFVKKEYLNEEKTDIKLIAADGKYIEIHNLKASNIASIKFKEGKKSLEQVVAGTRPYVPGVPEDITPTDVMSLFMKTLVDSKVSGVQAVDEAIYVSSYGKYNDFGSLVEEFKENILNNTGERYSDEQTNFLQEFCGINLENADTGSISGSDAGGSVVKTAESVVPEPEGMTVADFVYKKDKTIQAEDFSGLIAGTSKESPKKEFYYADVAGVSLYWNEDNWDDLVEQGIDRSVLEQLVGGIINAWTVPSLELAKESYGLSLTDETSILTELENGNKGIQICFENNPDSTGMAYVWFQPYSLGDKKGVDEVLVVNTAYYHEKLSDVNGVSSSELAGYLDRTIAHELVHAVMAANIPDFDELPLIIKEGTAELAHGVDDERKVDILDLTDTTFAEPIGNVDYDLKGLLNYAFDYKNADLEPTSTIYGAGYMILRYLAKNVVEGGIVGQDNAQAMALSLINNAELGFTDNALSDNALTDLTVDAYDKDILKITGNA